MLFFQTRGSINIIWVAFVTFLWEQTYHFLVYIICSLIFVYIYVFHLSCLYFLPVNGLITTARHLKRMNEQNY
jgi:hypothetical protein